MLFYFWKMEKIGTFLMETVENPLKSLNYVKLEYLETMFKQMC